MLVSANGVGTTKMLPFIRPEYLFRQMFHPPYPHAETFHLYQNTAALLRISAVVITILTQPVILVDIHWL